MAIIAKRSATGGDFTPVSEGLHPAVCWAIVDLGIQRKGGAFPGEKHEVYFGFEVLDQAIEYEKDGVKKSGPMRIGMTLTNSFHEKAKMRRHLEKWRGKPFTDAELDGFDLETVAGQPCQLLVTHTAKGDKTYANIENILGWPKDKPKPAKPESLLVYSLDLGERNLDRVPKWLQERLAERVADNWDEFNASHRPQRPARHEDITPESVQGDVGGFDDDIPF